MIKTIEAVFDGKFFLPKEPVELEPNTQVTITVETHEEPQSKPKSFFDTALSLSIDGPADWSERFDDYLYGIKLDDNE